MTKKHFIALAAGFRKARSTYSNTPMALDAIDTCVTMVADLCAEVNPNFDADKFYAAIYGKEA